MFGRDALSKLAGRDDAANARSATPGGGPAAGGSGPAPSSSKSSGGSKFTSIFSGGSSSSSAATSASTPTPSSRKPPKERAALRPPASIPPKQYLTPEAVSRHHASRSASHGGFVPGHGSPAASRSAPSAPPPASAPAKAERREWSVVDVPRRAPVIDDDVDVEEERRRILAATGEWGHRQTSSLDSTRSGSLPTRTSSRGVALARLNLKDLPPPPPARGDGPGMSSSNSLPSLASASSSAPPSPNLASFAVLPPRPTPPQATAARPSQPVPSPPVRPALPTHSSSTSSAAWDALLSRAASSASPAASPPLPGQAFASRSTPPLPSPPLSQAPHVFDSAASMATSANETRGLRQVPSSQGAAERTPKGPNATARPPPVAASSASRPARPAPQTADWGNLLSRTAGAAPSSILGPPSFHVPSASSGGSRAPQVDPQPPVSRAPPAHANLGAGGSGGWDALLSRAQGSSSSSSTPPASQTSAVAGPGARVAALFKSRPTLGRGPSSPDELPATLPLDPPAVPALSQPRYRSPSPSSRAARAVDPPAAVTAPKPLSKESDPPRDRPARPQHTTAATVGPPLSPITTPNLLSKRETRLLPPNVSKPSIGITGLVRAPEGQRGPRAKVEMLTSPCICCSATLQYPKAVASFRCTVCGTITDVHLSERRAAGLGKSTDPEPLTLARFEHLLAEARAAKSPAPSISSARRDSQDDDVADACTLEGDSTDEEDGQGLTSTAALSLYGKTNWFDALEDELFSVFSHWSSLSGSFSNSLTPSWTEPGVNMDELQRFYLLLSTLPAELGLAVVRGLEGLLRRPKRRFEAAPAGLGWVLVVLENPALFRPGSSSSQSSGSVLKRFLGIVSNLPNEAHHYLVGWLDVVYDTARFERKIELINIALIPRIRKHALAVTAPANRKSNEPLSYSHDWRFRSAARVLSLFFASNAHRTRLPVSAFYVTLADHLDAVLDYETWIRTAHKKSKSSFFLSQYPFLMSLGAKLKVLVHDSKRQQDQAGSSYIGMDGRRTVQPFITIRVRRERLLEDSLSQISSSIDHLKRALRIEFTNEEGVDAGGLKKEWFLLLCRHLFDARFGMWVQEDESNLCWFNPASFETDEQYTLVGVVVGLAVYHATALDIPLPTAAFKRLLNKPVDLADLAHLRPSLAKGLQDLLDFDGDVEETYCRSFVGEYESFGEVISVPLVPGGASIAVTEANRQDYVDRLVQFHLVTAVSRQFRAFQRGWLSVVEGNALSLFSAEEIELCVRGSPEPLDIPALRSVTKYDGCGEDEPLIDAFWQIVGRFDLNRQRKLLAFVTGSDRIPAQGLVNLDFRIQLTRAPPTHLPSSHTCFNTISLPRYPSGAVLESKLVDAILESSGFGLK